VVAENQREAKASGCSSVGGLSSLQVQGRGGVMVRVTNV
jgi:hypothetical protein